MEMGIKGFHHTETGTIAFWSPDKNHGAYSRSFLFGENDLVLWQHTVSKDTTSWSSNDNEPNGSFSFSDSNEEKNEDVAVPVRMNSSKSVRISDIEESRSISPLPEKIVDVDIISPWNVDIDIEM